MALDPKFLSILCCPQTKRALKPLSRSRLGFLNQAVQAGTVLNAAGARVNSPLTDALIRDDDQVIFRIDDGIPVLLADEAIGTTQFTDFPA